MGGHVSHQQSATLLGSGGNVTHSFLDQQLYMSILEHCLSVIRSLLAV